MLDPRKTSSLKIISKITLNTKRLLSLVKKILFMSGTSDDHIKGNMLSISQSVKSPTGLPINQKEWEM